MQIPGPLNENEKERLIDLAGDFCHAWREIMKDSITLRDSAEIMLKMIGKKEPHLASPGSYPSTHIMNINRNIDKLNRIRYDSVPGFYWNDDINLWEAVRKYVEMKSDSSIGDMSLVIKDRLYHSFQEMQETKEEIQKYSIRMSGLFNLRFATQPKTPRKLTWHEQRLTDMEIGSTITFDLPDGDVNEYKRLDENKWVLAGDDYMFSNLSDTACDQLVHETERLLRLDKEKLIDLIFKMDKKRDLGLIETGKLAMSCEEAGVIVKVEYLGGRDFKTWSKWKNEDKESDPGLFGVAGLMFSRQYPIW